MAADKLDIVVYGATGFVGALTASYLANHAPDDARIGLAGRSRQRLEDVRQRLGGRAVDWPVIVADSSDRAALNELAASTTAVATTVGPYARYGFGLVAACAEQGTHYADLTGEPIFVRRTIDDYDEAARRTGARIVHSAGFDSIPSDLGVLLLHEAVLAGRAGELEDTTFVLKGVKGGISGGTIASGMTQMENLAADPSLRKLVADPYALSPQRDKEPDKVNSPWPNEADLQRPVHDDELGQWLAPFMMAAVNTRVVRRSNALLDWSYGRKFRYREVMGCGDGPVGFAKAAGVTAGLAAAFGGLSFAPSRNLLARVLPKPGEGPSEKTRRNGYFIIEIHATTSTGARFIADVAGKGDPGYAATAVMLGESVLALAFDGDKLPPTSGILTPATGIGSALIDRLRAAGMTFEAKRVS